MYSILQPTMSFGLPFPSVESMIDKVQRRLARKCKLAQQEESDGSRRVSKLLDQNVNRQSPDGTAGFTIRALLSFNS